MAIKRSVGCSCCGCAWSDYSELMSATVPADTATVLSPTFKGMMNYEFANDMFGFVSGSSGFECTLEFISTDETTVYDTLVFKQLDGMSKVGAVNDFSATCSEGMRYAGGFGYEKNSKSNVLAMSTMDVEPDTYQVQITNAVCSADQASANGWSTSPCALRGYPTGEVGIDDIPCSSVAKNAAQCPSLAHAEAGVLVPRVDKWSQLKSTLATMVDDIDFLRLYYLKYDEDQEGQRDATCTYCPTADGVNSTWVLSGQGFGINTGNCWTDGQQVQTVSGLGAAGSLGNSAITNTMYCPSKSASTEIEPLDDGFYATYTGNQGLHIVQSSANELSGGSATLQIMRYNATNSTTVTVSVSNSADITVTLAAGEFIKEFSVTAPTATAGSPQFYEPSGSTYSGYVLNKMRVRDHVIELPIQTGSDAINIDSDTFVQGEWYPFDRTGWTDVDFKIRIECTLDITRQFYREQQSRREDTGCFDPKHESCQIDGECKAKPEYHVQPITVESVTETGEITWMPPFVNNEVSGCGTDSLFAVDRSNNNFDLGVPSSYRQVQHQTNVLPSYFVTDTGISYIGLEDAPVDYYQNTSCTNFLGDCVPHTYLTEWDYDAGFEWFPAFWPSPIQLAKTIGSCTTNVSCFPNPFPDLGWVETKFPWISTLSDTAAKQEAYTEGSGGYLASFGVPERWESKTANLTWYDFSHSWGSYCGEFDSATDTVEDLFSFKPHDNNGVERVLVYAEVVKPRDVTAAWSQPYDIGSQGDYFISKETPKGLMFFHNSATSSVDYIGQVTIDTLTSKTLGSYSQDFKDLVGAGNDIWIEVSDPDNPSDDGYWKYDYTAGVLSLTGQTSTEPSTVPEKIGVSASLTIDHLSHPRIHEDGEGDIDLSDPVLGEGTAVAGGIEFDVILEGRGAWTIDTAEATLVEDDVEWEYQYGDDAFILLGGNGTLKRKTCTTAGFDNPINPFDVDTGVPNCYDPTSQEYDSCNNEGLDVWPFGGSAPSQTKTAPLPPTTDNSASATDYILRSITSASDLVLVKTPISAYNNPVDIVAEDVCCDNQSAIPATVDKTVVDLEQSPAADLSLIDNPDACSLAGKLTLYQFTSTIDLGSTGDLGFAKDIGIYSSHFYYKTKWVDCWEGLPDFTGLTFDGATDGKVDSNGDPLNEDIIVVTGIEVAPELKVEDDGTVIIPTTVLTETLDTSGLSLTLKGLNW